MTRNWKVFREGFNLCVKHNRNTAKVQNPYPKDSEDWKDWNRGWNAAP